MPRQREALCTGLPLRDGQKKKEEEKSSKTEPPPTPPLSSLALYPPLSETTPHKGVEVPPPYAHTIAPSASPPTPNPTPPCRTASPSAPNPCHHPPPCPQPCPNPLPQGHGSGGPAFMAPCVLLAEATCLAPVSIHNPLSSRAK